MLHEILLSLSGLHSPIWESARRQGDQGESGLNQYLSPPETAMLETLAHLHDIHVHIKTSTAVISTSHLSMVCRAVSSSITQDHLGRFTKHIVHVEASILRKDASYVGAYDIVPLSSIVSEFAPWSRRLEWLSALVSCMEGKSQTSRTARPSSAAQILDFLERETHTGYSDIEEMAISLLAVAQRAWMRSAAMWMLYGRLPVAGAEDFCVQRNAKSSSSIEDFSLVEGLAPAFLSDVGRQALLATGTALNHLRVQASTDSAGFQAQIDHPTALLPSHLRLLDSMQYPLSSPLLEDTIQSINQSISENALSQLLPLRLITQFLELVSRYVLLGHGEFAVSLIAHADEKVVSRSQSNRTNLPIRKIGQLDDLAVKDVELNSILSKALAELASIQGHEEVEDDVFVLAKSLLCLKGIHRRPAQANDMIISTLLPSPAHLMLSIPPASSLRMFVSPDDVSMYADINAYLLSMHRARIHLACLWKLTSQRRCHPTPLGPPQSGTPNGLATLQNRRARETWRMQRTRRHWTTASQVLFLMNEMSSYLQGEVISQSWLHFSRWLRGEDALLPSARSSRPGTASSTEHGRPELSTSTTTLPTDPRALASAHRIYLRALYRALLLECTEFLSPLRDLLGQIDHFIALFSRLQAVWEGLDLQEDDGIVDAFSNYAQDEKEVLSEMDRTAELIQGNLVEVVERVRDSESQKGEEPKNTELVEGFTELQIGKNGKTFIPWKGRTVDRLVMKLDSLVMRDDLKDDLQDDLDND